MKNCPKCNKEYPDQYKFCLTDGATLALSEKQSEPQILNLQETENNDFWQNPLVYVGGALGIIFLLTIIAIFNTPSNTTVSSRSSSATTSANTAGFMANKTSDATRVTSNIARPAANLSNNSDYRIGKIGRLDTNLRLRGASNKFSTIAGVHYRGARVRVLEVESYDTPEGYSIWFRVEVIENGCDSEGKLGCGSEGEDEGWMNSKYITLE